MNLSSHEANFWHASSTLEQYMEYDFAGLGEDLEEDGSCVPCLSIFHSHRTSPPPLRHVANGRGSTLLLEEDRNSEPATGALLTSAWDFSWPNTSMLIPTGFPSDPNMQTAAVLQREAEREYVNDTFAENRELHLKLRLGNFALEVSKNSIEKLKEKVASLETELDLCKKRLEEFERKEAAHDRICQDIWGPIRRGERDTSMWDPLPCLLDSPVSTDYMNRPLILTHVAEEMGYKCNTPSDLRRLTTSVYDAYTRVHGYAPSPKIWYDVDGNPQRLCCFTQRDKDLVMSVIAKEGATLFQEVSVLVQARSGAEALM